MKRLGCGLILGLMAWTGAAQAEPVTLTATVDREEVAVGEPVRYVLTLTRPAALAMAWPKVETLLSEFELYDSGSEPSSTHQGTVTDQRWYQLASFSIGSHTIPAPVVTYREADGTDQNVRGNPVAITVTSQLPTEWESLDIRKAKPLLRIRRDGWLWTLLGLLVLAGAAGGYWWWRARRLGVLVPAPPPRPPHEIALEALERLRQESLPSRNAYEEYYVRLSDIARSYIEARFSLKAPEMTTEEFLQMTSAGQALSSEHRSLLQAFLVHCDLVKFARYQPSVKEADEAFTAAQRFVKETIPAPASEQLAERLGDGGHAA